MDQVKAKATSSALTSKAVISVMLPGNLTCHITYITFHLPDTFYPNPPIIRGINQHYSNTANALAL